MEGTNAQRAEVQQLELAHTLDENGIRVRSGPQRTQEAGGDRLLAGRATARSLPEEGDSKRPALRSGKVDRYVVEHVVEKVPKSGIGKLGLGRRGSRGQNAVGALPGELDASSPERRLADADLAFEQQGTPASVEERLDRAELLLPADELGDPLLHKENCAPGDSNS